MKCCDFNAGMLREPVEFQRASKTSDGAGGYTEAWVPVLGAPDRAHVKASSGRERFVSDRIEASYSWKVTVRYSAGILESDRIEIRGRVHNITFINNVELRDKWLVIAVDGGVAT